jgi:hypothetical protein
MPSEVNWARSTVRPAPLPKPPGGSTSRLPRSSPLLASIWFPAAGTRTAPRSSISASTSHSRRRRKTPGEGRATRLTWSRQTRCPPSGLPERPLATARPPRTPVPPVLSGRDQASPTPFDDFRGRSEALDAVRIRCDCGDHVVVDTANPGNGNPQSAPLPPAEGRGCSIRLAQFEALARICGARGLSDIMCLTIIWSSVGCRSHGLDPPSCRDPCR